MMLVRLEFSLPSPLVHLRYNVTTARGCWPTAGWVTIERGVGLERSMMCLLGGGQELGIVVLLECLVV